MQQSVLLGAHSVQVAQKYPTAQSSIFQQPCEIFIRKFPDLCGRDPVMIFKEILLTNKKLTKLY